MGAKLPVNRGKRASTKEKNNDSFAELIKEVFFKGLIKEVVVTILRNPGYKTTKK